MEETKVDEGNEASGEKTYHLTGIDISGKRRRTKVQAVDLDAAFKKAGRLGFKECQEVDPPKERRRVPAWFKLLVLVGLIGLGWKYIGHPTAYPPDMTRKMAIWDADLSTGNVDQVGLSMAHIAHFTFKNMRIRELPHEGSWVLIHAIFGKRSADIDKTIWKSEITSEGWSKRGYEVAISHHISEFDKNGKGQKSVKNITYRWNRYGLWWAVDKVSCPEDDLDWSSMDDYVDRASTTPRRLSKPD